MKSSFSRFKCLAPVPILAVVAMQLLLIQNALSLNLTSGLNQTNEYLHHKCINSEGTYKSGSLYEKEIKRATESISEYSFQSDFIQAAVGKNYTIYYRYQCRGDLSKSQCGNCLTTAVPEILKRCPRNKGRIIWYDYCVLEITSVFRWPQLDSQNIFYLHNAKDVTGNKELFNKKTKALLNNLKEKAVNGRRRNKTFLYSAGKESLETTKTLYAMVECTKDVSRKNCSVCLDGVIAKLPKCCNGKQGGRVLCASCNFRYELYPFVKPRVNGSSV